MCNYFAYNRFYKLRFFTFINIKATPLNYWLPRDLPTMEVQHNLFTSVHNVRCECVILVVVA